MRELRVAIWDVSALSLFSEFVHDFTECEKTVVSKSNNQKPLIDVLALAATLNVRDSLFGTSQVLGSVLRRGTHDKSEFRNPNLVLALALAWPGLNHNGKHGMGSGRPFVLLVRSSKVISPSRWHQSCGWYYPYPVGPRHLSAC